jgi:hypothetical protein
MCSTNALDNGIPGQKFHVHAVFGGMRNAVYFGISAQKRFIELSRESIMLSLHDGS